MRVGVQRILWPEEKPLPPLLHAVTNRIARHSAAPQRAGRFERMMEKVPGGKSDIDNENFVVYRLQIDRRYCPAPK
jgi:hypothetical protein